jgi:predicted RNA-binding Zn ribbon-like protein
VDVTADSVADDMFLLDLLNSTPTVEGVRQDGLRTADQGQRWLRAHGHTGSAAELRALRECRTILQDLVRGEGSAARLSGLLTGLSGKPSVDTDGVHWTLQVPRGQEPAVRAVLAWDAVRRLRPGRLRACENPECTQFLIDQSKPNNARWCSMAVCGNRLKARRHYERSRTRLDRATRGDS